MGHMLLQKPNYLITSNKQFSPPESKILAYKLKKTSPNCGGNITLRHKNFACVKRGANLTTKPYELPYYLIENRAFKAPPR